MAARDGDVVTAWQEGVGSEKGVGEGGAHELHGPRLQRLPPHHAKPQHRNNTSMIVPLFIFVVSVLTGTKLLASLSTADRVIQLIALVVNTLPLVVAAISPPAYAAHRSLLVSASRLALAASPCATPFLERLLSGASPLGQRWAAGPSPLGTLGLFIFSSRSLLLFVAALDSRMSVAATAAVQAAMWAGGARKDPDLCTTAVVTAPGVESALRLVHGGLAAAGGLVLPVIPFFPGPPSRVVNPGASFYAISLLLKVYATVAPVAMAARRAAASYLLCLRWWKEQGVVPAAVPRPGLAAAAALAAARLRRRAPVHAALLALLTLLGCWCACYAWAVHACGSRSL